MEIIRFLTRSARSMRPLLTELEEELLGFERLPPERLVGSGRWMADAPVDYCSSCGASALGRGCRADCHATNRVFHGVIRLGSYVDPLAEWIRAMKFERWHAMGRVLGRELAFAIARHPVVRTLDDPMVVPVPMPALRRFSRRIDHTKVIADAIGREHGWAVRRLMRQGGGSTQASRTASQRTRRRNPFRRGLATQAIPGRDVILVDDVLTTGRTAGDAVRILHQMGASKVVLAVIAVTNDLPGGGGRRI